MEDKREVPWITNPFRLWSLEDMLRIAAGWYVHVGEYIERTRTRLQEMERLKWPVTVDDLSFYIDMFNVIKNHCDELQLAVSSALLSKTIQTLNAAKADPANAVAAEHTRIGVILDAVVEEMRTQLFLFVPLHRAIYYERAYSLVNMKTGMPLKFPKAVTELFHAGNCYATGEYTASVFHSMRAVEIGLRAMAIDLKITLPHPIELAEWKILIDKIEANIRDMDRLPKSMERDDMITFYSNAASQFRYFKAYRNLVAHARDAYEEPQAHSILDRTKDFLESLAPKMSEPEAL